jgi:alkylation response protein AidB-like acyl-CoA dehydrogenase
MNSVFSKEVASKFRLQSQQVEESKKIPQEWLQFIYEEKLFKLFVPKESGGLMMPLPKALRVFDTAAFIDGNFGWAITIGSGGGYFYGYMQPETAKKVFNNKKAVIAGSGKPSTISKEEKGGYRVGGKWAFCSGAPYATAFTANVVIKKGASSMIRAFTFLPEQVKIHHDWNAIGMKATESHTISVDNVFVPNEMTFDLSISEPIYKHPFYKYPFLQFAETSFAALTIGLGRHFIGEAKNMSVQNKSNWASIPGRYEFVKKRIAENEKTFLKEVKSFYAIAEKSWDELTKKSKMSLTTRKEVSKMSKKVSRNVLHSADDIIQYMGMNAIMEDCPINRVWRDIHTACQHVLLVPFGSL